MRFFFVSVMCLVVFVAACGKKDEAPASSTPVAEVPSPAPLPPAGSGSGAPVVRNAAVDPRANPHDRPQPGAADHARAAAEAAKLAPPAGTEVKAEAKAEGDHAGCGNHPAGDKEPAGEHGCAERKAQAEKDWAAGARKFGTPLAAGEAIPVEAVVDAPEKFSGPVKVTGTVDAVCQVGGCWFVVRADKDATKSIRFSMKDHSFTVPPSIKGAKAIVEGAIAPPPPGSAPPPGKLRMTATGMEVGS